MKCHAEERAAPRSIGAQLYKLHRESVALVVRFQVMFEVVLPAMLRRSFLPKNDRSELQLHTSAAG